MVSLEMLSPYAGFRASPEADTLFVHFCHRNCEPGRFSQVAALADLPNPILFLNCVHTTWFREGVPGLGDDPRSAAKALTAFAKRRGFKRVVATGYSMGGYGALLYGALAGADLIVAFSPEGVLNLALNRSFAHLRGAPSEYDAVAPFLQKRNPDKTLVFVGASEPADMVQGAMLSKTATVRTVSNCRHGTIGRFHRKRLLVPMLRELAESGTYTCAAELTGELAADWLKHGAGEMGPETIMATFEKMAQANPSKGLIQSIAKAKSKYDRGRAWGGRVKPLRGRQKSA